GLAYQRLERLSEAAHAFTACEQLAPADPTGPLNLAVVLDAQGEHEEARQALLRAAALAPEDREIHEALERFVAQAGAEGAAVALGKQRGQPEDSAEALGSILLHDKLIDRAQLVRLVFDQALMALGEITSWSEGAFSFHPGDGGEPPPVSFSVQQVVLELMRR